MSNISQTTQIFGRNPVLEALHQEVDLEKVYLQQGTTGEFEKVLRHLCKKRDIVLQVVPKEKISRICSGNHQGVVALKALVPFYKLEDVISHAFESGKTPLFLLCDEITDVRNLGAIARSALAFDVDALVVTSGGSAPIQADSIKASAGALLTLPVSKVPNMLDAIKLLKDSGITVVATSIDDSKPLFEMDANLPLAILLGSEDMGVRPHLLNVCHETIKIPHSVNMESLNVSVAAGIVLYEVNRQRFNSNQ